MNDDTLRDAEEAVRVTPTASPTVYTGPRGRPRDDLSRSASSASSNVPSIDPERSDPEVAAEDRRPGALGGAGDMGGVSCGGFGGRRPPSAREARASVHNKKDHDRQRNYRGKAHKEKFTHDTSNYVFPPVSMSQSEFKSAFADELHAEARRASYGKRRKSLYRKATAFLLCGIRTMFRMCCGCDEAREGSGVQTAAEGAYPCRLRTCGLCARRESNSKRRRLLRILRRLPRHPGFGYRMITLQIAYDPEDPEEVTVDSIRARLEGAAAAMRSAWSRYLKALGGGLFWTLEIGRCGFVHAHALHFGPKIDQDAFEHAARRGYSAAAKTWLVYLGKDPNSQKQRSAIFEVCKYVAKGPSPLSEAWIDGVERDVTHPAVAARWEVASLNKHTVGYHGVFRSEAAAEDEEKDGAASSEIDASAPASTMVEASTSSETNDVVDGGESRNDDDAPNNEGVGDGANDGSSAEQDGQECAADPAADSREPERPDDDRHVACLNCGTVGQWRWEFQETTSFVAMMHQRGKRAFFRSRWRPSIPKTPKRRTYGADFVFISRKQYALVMEGLRRDVADDGPHISDSLWQIIAAEIDVAA